MIEKFYSFVSKLLTAVLTNHLGWVSTVAPGDHQTPAPIHPSFSTASQTSWVSTFLFCVF